MTTKYAKFDQTINTFAYVENVWTVNTVSEKEIVKNCPRGILFVQQIFAKYYDINAPQNCKGPSVTRWDNEIM
jgi:hypothetical protein